MDTSVQVLALQVSPQNSPASVFTSVGQGNHSCLPPWAAVETLPSRKRVNSCGWDCEGHLERPDKWGLGSVWMGPWGRERVEAHVVKSHPIGRALNPRPQTFLGVALTVMAVMEAPKVGEAGTVILTVILRWQRQMASSWVLGPLRQEAPMPPALWWVRASSHQRACAISQSPSTVPTQHKLPLRVTLRLIPKAHVQALGQESCRCQMIRNTLREDTTSPSRADEIWMRACFT